MKNVCLYLCILLYGYTAMSQDPNNHWRYRQIDLDFSTNPFTVNVLTTNGSNSSGSSISDANGNLLFYCTANGIYNRNGQGMSGYVGVDSLPFSQASIILPHPGDITKFFVFFAENFATLGSSNYSYYYCVLVDFSNNPFGEIISAERLKDISGIEIENNGDQRPLTYTTNAADNGYWVLVENEGEILSYQVTTSGISAPTVAYQTPLLGDRSMMRFAPDYSNPNIIYLFTAHGSLNRLNFNKSTGLLTNKTEISIGAYGTSNFEFSNDFAKVYFTSSAANRAVLVKDLTSLTTPPRILNDFASPSTPSSELDYIQKDKYGNLLVGGYEYGNKTEYIHKIENPESFLNSSVRVDYVSLNGEGVVNFQQLNPPTLFVPANCFYNISLTAQETRTNYTYAAVDTITTKLNYTINSGTITFKAGGAIYVKPNTHLKTGSTVVAKIEECDGQGRQAIQVSENLVSENSVIYETSDQSFAMYPNPTNQSTTIQLSKGTIQSVTVTSIEGLTMFRRDDINTESYELYVSIFKPGIYVITIQTKDGKTLTEKLMKN